MTMKHKILTVCLILNSYLTLLEGIEMVNMKIVEEPSSYGLNNFNNQNSLHEEKQLTLRVQPSNFSGPEHLRRLNNKCFSKQIDSYTYKFCPFSNVTQHEESYRWNPYNGVLGVWQEWEIQNNKFVAMVMTEGDNCGNVFRSAKVIFRCGNKNEIVNVSEPNTCQYHINFNSPYVCHPHAMLVFPTLSKDLRDEWELLEGRLANEEITDKGYTKQLHGIFVKAGYCLSNTDKAEISKKAVKTEEKKEKEDNGEFDTLFKCTQEYQKLKQELEALKMVLKTSEGDKERKAKTTKNNKNKADTNLKGGTKKKKKSVAKLINLMTKNNTGKES